MRLHRLRNRLRRLAFGASSLPVWHEPRYRLPVTSLAGQLGLELRRADYALSYLVDSQLVVPETVRRPRRIGFDAIARVHSQRWIDQLHRGDGMLQVFGSDDLPIDEVMTSVRLAAGGTLEATRVAMRLGGPCLNLLGGFHHASPDRGAGLCPINDIAIAVATLRHEGFPGQVVILDLDAHPPDGTAACLKDDPKVYIGSLSGSDWGEIEGADETVLPEGAGDRTYLRELAALLRRLPDPDLSFIIAGGDVLEGDKLGLLGMTLDGVRRRDLMVAETLHGRPQVWLPGGGYSDLAWRVLAGSALAILGVEAKIPDGYNAIAATYARIARRLSHADLTGGRDLEMAEVLAELGVGHLPSRRLFGFYTESGVEYALEQYGFLPYLRRLGYGEFRVELQQKAERGRVRLFAQAQGREHLLAETVLEIRTIDAYRVLYVHWHTARDSARIRPGALPGQEHPGLGLAKETSDLFGQMALRLELDGVAFTPSYFHVAYLARERAEFIDHERQARFEAMLRDLEDLGMLEVTNAVDDGRVRMNGEIYRWEADDMLAWPDGPKLDRKKVKKARQRYRFTIDPERRPRPPARTSRRRTGR